MSGLTKTEVTKIKKIAKKGQYAEALRQLAESKDEMITPYDVVDAARDEKSPLHQAFTWDDKKAGERYRLIEARILLTTVKVEFQGERQQAFFNANITVGNIQRRGYFPIERVMSESQIREAVLRDAVRELKHAQEKYKQLSEMKGIINARKLKKIEDDLNKKKN